jgi:hypothetical protein
MKTMTRTIEQEGYDHETQRIRVGVARILRKRGLLPRFKRWRLAQDPDTGMVVFFGVLNHGYIAAHASAPFSDYFNPRVLHELANQLQVQVVSCNTDGLRYAFILDRGRLDKLPTHVDFPYVDDNRLSLRVVYRDTPPSRPASPVNSEIADHNAIRRGAQAFLKIFEDIQLKSDAAALLSAQSSPDIVLIDEDEFSRRVAEHEEDRRRSKHLRALFDETGG